MRIGFVGLGYMGGDQAELIAKSFELTVYDVSSAAMERLAGKAKLAASVAEVGRNADVVGVCVRDDNQVRDVVDGDDGLIAAMAPGAVILIHSTVSPKTVIDLAAKAEARGVTLIDSAVTRTVLTPGGPFVFTMTGGAPEVTERVRPVLETFATDILHIGPLGSAMVLKICNNLMTQSAIMTARQAYALAAAGGVPMEKLTQVTKTNGALTPIAESNIYRRQRSSASDAELMAHAESSAGNCEKDFAMAVSIGEELGVSLPTAVHGREIYRWATTKI